MDRNLALEIVRVTESAALSSARWMGKGDAGAAVSAAVDSMDTTFRSIAVSGTVVIGIGNTANDLLRSGQTIGTGSPPKVDIAIDPLECINSVAYGRANAMAIVVVAPRGGLLKVPNIYMEKLAVGPDAADCIDLDLPLGENLKRIAEVKKRSISNLTIVILDRERHRDLIREAAEVGARVHLIPDGDVAAAIAAALPGTGIDALVGTGGAPEGVLAAAALRCIGGCLQSRLVRPDHPLENDRMIGTLNFDRVLSTEDMAQGDIMFAATGVTDGDLLQGVRYRRDGATSHSLIMRSASRTRRFMVTEHYFDDRPQY